MKAKTMVELEKELVESDKLHASIYAGNTEEPSGETDVEPEPVIEIEDNLKTAKTQESSNQPTDEHSEKPEDVQPGDESKKPATEPQETVSPVGEPPEEGAWQHRYNVLVGKYNTEVPRLHDMVKSQTAQITELEKNIEKIQTSEGTRKTTEPVVEKPVQELKQSTQYITDKDEEDFTKELVDLVLRGARQEIERYIAGVESKVDKKINDAIGSINTELGNIKSTQVRTVEEKYYDDLNTLAPDWQKIRDLPEFEGWLNQQDDFTGFYRISLLQDAFNNLDVNRTARIYNAFAGSLKKPASAQVIPTQTAELITDDKKTHPKIEDMIAPAKSKATKVVDTGKNKERRHVKELSQASDKVRQGKMTVEQFEKLSREIDEAQREGRLDIH